MKLQIISPLFIFLAIITTCLHAQPLLQTGGIVPMPAIWIDKDTHHKVVRLTNNEGANASFYFHNNPFVDSKMVYYNTSNNLKSLYTLDLQSLESAQLTAGYKTMIGEIVGLKKKQAYFQVADSVFAVDLATRQTKLLFVFPGNYKANITTVNADETLLAGAKASDEQKEISKKFPNKSDYFQKIFDAHLPNDLFIINIATGELKKIHSENTWIGHVQFSPANPKLLMFCHEGPWHKVDRIWNIDVVTGAVKLMHKRTMDMEIAGHEWFAPDGKTIWYDLQLPKGETFFVEGVNVQTGKQTRYALQRDEWSIHFNVSADQRLFCGDGGDSSQVAKAKNGQWIYLFTPSGNKFISEKLVNMQFHNYKLEPNVHFSPDGKWIIFRANFEGTSQSYAVEIKQSN